MGILQFKIPPKSNKQINTTDNDQYNDTMIHVGSIQDTYNDQYTPVLKGLKRGKHAQPKHFKKLPGNCKLISNS
jgi:hypothetical protein